MKKRLFLILSVSIMLFAGCGNKDNITADTETEKTETVRDTGETDIAGDTETPAAAQTENRETTKQQTEKETPKETEPEEEETEAAETQESKPESQPEQKAETEPAQNSTDVPKPEGAEPEQEAKPEGTEPECEAKPEETKPEETKQQEQAVTAVSYDPVSVCSKAVAKCQAGGMITTTDNLANLLSEGKITQEEYNSYYPYDGLGYYSVFVETDLNRASTTSGRKLGSEDEIADYIAGMMLLETEPVFNIEYAGVYNLNGTDFYEFRCYR